MNHSEHNAYRLFSQTPFQTSLTNYYTGIIPNNTYKLLSDTSFQTMLTNHYQRIYSKQQCLNPILFTENSFQTVLFT